MNRAPGRPRTRSTCVARSSAKGPSTPVNYVYDSAYDSDYNFLDKVVYKFIFNIFFLIGVDM
jgi:hypothetical protein